MEKLFKKIISGFMTISFAAGLFVVPAHAENNAASDVLADDEIVYKTVFDEPSKDWESESTPIGNGILGAMVFGGYAVDQIQFNESSVWSGGQTETDFYNGGNGGEQSTNYSNLSKFRDYLQTTLADFTKNHAAYKDANGKVVAPDDYPALSAEAQGWLDSLKGRKTEFGYYQTTGDIYISDYITPAIKKKISQTITSNETNNSTVANLIDGDAMTVWTSDGTDMPITAEITYGEAVTFKAYRMTAPSDRGTNGNTPSKWTLYGSEDGNSYTEIDTRSNVVFDYLGESKIFEMEDEVTYRYLKLEIQRVNKNGSVVKLGELEFLPSDEAEAENAVYSNYKRTLDMNNSLVTVSYKKDGVKYDREYFASYPNNFIGMRLRTDKEDALNKYIYFGTINGNPKMSAVVDNNIGKVTLEYEIGSATEKEKVACQMRIVADDGATVSYDAANPLYIHVENADDIQIYMTADTNYVECMDDTFDYLTDDNPMDAVESRLNQIENQSYDALKSAHIADYRELFTRVSLRLNGASFPEYMTTKELVQGYKGGTNTDAENRYLEMLYYQMGRYLMISGSREGGLPLNLQGLWNNSNHPSWHAGYTTNINAEMNYWIAETTNLSECHEPMTTFIKAQIPRGRKTAQLYHYNVNEYEKNKTFTPARGWVCYHNLNIWGNTGPDKSQCFYFPTAAAWLCQDIWEHYAFTLDKKFLEENFYIMKEAALFWVDNLVTDERDGTLVSSPGHSPEHGGISMGTAGDQVIIWELFNDTLQAAEVLGIQGSDEIKEIKEAMGKLSLPKIGLAGQFQEWKDETQLDISGHNEYKHVTHLFAIYPGSFVVPGRSEQDDVYADAIRESLRVRGGSGTGWGKAWKVGLWARARNGEKAGEMMSNLLSDSTLSNLFDTHPPFQIDGNFGAVAGMTEMMLQSQGDSLELMAAMPSMWRDGSVTGLRARGGITVDMDWADNDLTDAHITSDVDNNKLSVSCPKISKMSLYDSHNNEVEFTADTDDKITFAAEAGETYTIAATEDSKNFLKNAKVYKENGKVTKALLTFNENAGSDISAYYAAYDNSGRLLGLSSARGTGSSEITVNSPDSAGSGNIASEILYIWDDRIQPLSKKIDVSTLPEAEGGDQPANPSPEPSEGYFIDEDFNSTRGDWGFTGKNRTYITNQLLKFAGGGADEMDIKTMDKSVADSKHLSIEFDWRSDTDLSSNGRTAIFELMDKNNRTFFGLYSNTRNSEGIKYTTSKNAYDDEDLAYVQFPTFQSKNSDWYHVALTIDFADGKIVKVEVKRGGNTILTLTNEPIAAVNFDKMRMIDYYSVAGMSLDNVKIKRAELAPSDDTSLKSAVIKGRSVTSRDGASSPAGITDFGTIRVGKEAAVNPYKLTEFVPSNGNATVKAVKYAAETADFSDYDERDPYNDENIENNDIFIVEVTAQNGDKTYYGFITEVSDGSDEAYLETFEIMNNDKNLIDSFVFNKDLEPGGDYGSAELIKSVETVNLRFTTSDTRLTGNDTGLGSVMVTVNDSTGAYDPETGDIALDAGENVIKIKVTSYDGTANGIYTFTVNRTDYSYIEYFDTDKVPNKWSAEIVTITPTENNTLLFEQGGGSGPRSATGWVFADSPISQDTAEIDFDLKMTSGNHSSGNSGFYIVGSNSTAKGNQAFDYNGGIVGINLAANTSAANSMSVVSGSGTTSEPTMTAINNPAGAGRAFPWAHIHLAIDFSSKTVDVKITSRDDENDVWYEGDDLSFIDSSVSNLKGFQLTLGRAYAAQEIDNIKVKP